MRKSQVLATVSVIALSTGLSMSGARADVVSNLSINYAASPTLSLTAGAMSTTLGTIQKNEPGLISAKIDTTFISKPAGGTPDDYVNGAGNIVDVIANDASSTAIGNKLFQSIDLWVVDGLVNKGAGASTSVQVNRLGTSIEAKVSTTEIQAATKDFGTGSAQLVDSNIIFADGTGNTVTNIISGALNKGLVSTELGQGNIGDPVQLGLNASASIMSATAQVNDSLGSTVATVDSSRIGSLVIDPTVIDGTTISVQDNAIQATFTGNNGVTTVDLDHDLDAKNVADTTLDGTVGVINSQRSASADSTYLASVNGSVIEAGDSTRSKVDGTLDGAKIDFTGNDITARSLGNTAINTAHIDAVNINGVFPDTLSLVQDYTGLVAASGNGQELAYGDVFVDSSQWSQVTNSAQVGNVTDSDLNVLVQDLNDSSTVTAGTVGDGNTIGASAGANAVTNAIDVENVTTFDALTTLVSGQITGAGGNKQLASTKGDLTVSVGTLGASAGVIDTSKLTVDGNSLYAQAITNSGTNTIDIQANNVLGVGVDPAFQMARSWHSNLISRSTSDITLVNSQHTKDSTVSSKVVGSIIVDAADQSGKAGSKIVDAAISASGNSSTALTVGNTIDENRITAEATTFDASVGLVNFQLTQHNGGGTGLNLTASVAPTDDLANTAIINVDATAQDISGAASIVANSNVISAQVFGNLVNGNTNSINISGVTVSDKDMGSRTDAHQSVVDRATASDGLPETNVDAGFVLLSDQSFEDSEANPVKASVTGDFVDVQVGSTASTVSNLKTSVGLNKVTGAVALNTASNAINVDAQTLNANSNLVNVQTFWDEEFPANGSGSIDVDVTGDFNLQVDAGATTITNMTASANGNSVLASGRISNATNAVDITAGTQVVTDIIDGANIDSVNLSKNLSTLRAENGLLNDQDFDGLIGAGLTVDLNGNSVDLTVTTANGSLSNSTVEADGNAFKAQALANDAVNSMALKVGTYDISNADITNSTGNGPLGVIGNSQRGGDSGNIQYAGSINATASGVGVTVDVKSVDNAISGPQISVDGNSVRTLARINNASNTLDVSGTTYAQRVTTTPAIEAQGIPGGGSLAAEDLAFGIASYQLNGYDVNATVQNSNASILADGTAVAVSSSAITADGNLFVAEARGNDNSNQAAIKFTTNKASAFVANMQEADDGAPLVAADGGVTIKSSVTGTAIGIDADGTTEVISGSALSVSGNAVAALASANRALVNSLEISGTNIFSGTGDTTPFAAIDPANAGVADLTVNADIGVLNVQGAASVTADQTEDVVALVSGTTINALLNQVDTGSVRLDNNLVLGQGVIDSATNLLGVGVEYGYNSAGQLVATNLKEVTNVSGATAAILSQQIVAAGSSVDVQVLSTTITADAKDIDAAGAIKASVSGNQVTGEGIGGTSTNRLDVVASANITGIVGTPTPVLGDLTSGNPIVANADFNVVNYQAGEPDVATQVNGANLLLDIHSLVNGDALTVNNNAITASSTGFDTTNILVLNAGASSDATANVLNRQDIDNSAITSVINTPQIRAYSESAANSGALNSSVTVLNNDISANANGNVAQNALATTAGATLQESSGAGATINPSLAQPVVVTDSDYSVLNYQSLDASTVSAAINNADVFIDDFSGSSGVNNSALSVNGNQVTASATGNSSINDLVLNSGTFQHPTATIANLQSNTGATISASVSGATVGIGDAFTINAASTNSSFSVSGNSVGAISVGNSAINRITGN